MSETPCVHFIPLGGLGEVGMNCFALSDQGRMILVDCGATFPDDDWGVDLLHPDFSWVVERENRIDALVITHGHEDHIGAVPFLLKKLGRPIPIFAPEHALQLLKERMTQHALPLEELNLLEPERKVAIGPFQVEPVRVAHSIIGAMSLAIWTSAGLIVHTADFNLDEEQPAGHLTDAHRFQELGNEGVRLLLSDSTNIDTTVRPRHEGDVARALAHLVQSTPQRLVVAMFSSNIHRLLALGQAAVASGRRLCLMGRSLKRHFEVAAQMGRLKFPSSLLVAPEAVAELPANQVLVIAGGSQGEGASALRRLSLQTHPHLRLEPGDAVAFSARVIPGNERAVSTMVNDLLRQGVQIRDRFTDPEIHTSGHASRQELETMVEWTCPQSFIPVHGTLHHLKRHEALARSLGVEDTLVVENGAIVEVPPQGSLRVVERFTQRAVRVALGGSELREPVRRRRVDLGRRGLLVASVVIDARGGQSNSAKVSALGVPLVDGKEGVLKRIEARVDEVVASHAGLHMISLEDAITRTVARFLLDLCGVKPVVEVHVHRADSTGI